MLVPAEEHDSEQVEVAAQVALPAVLGAAGGAAPVVDLDLGDPETGLRRHHGDVAVQLAVDRDGLDDVTLVRLEPAVEVMERDARGLAYRPVEELGRQRLVQGILAPLLPSGHQVIAIRERRREGGDLGRVVLAVAVHGDEDVAAGGGEAMGKRRRLAEVAAQLDDAHVVPGLGQLLHHGEGSVARSVVDEDDLVGRAVAGQRLVDLAHERDQAVGLVVHRDDE